MQKMGLLIVMCRIGARLYKFGGRIVYVQGRWDQLPKARAWGPVCVIEGLRRPSPVCTTCVCRTLAKGSIRDAEEHVHKVMGGLQEGHFTGQDIMSCRRLENKSCFIFCA